MRRHYGYPLGHLESFHLAIFPSLTTTFPIREPNLKKLFPTRLAVTYESQKTLIRRQLA